MEGEDMRKIIMLMVGLWVEFRKFLLLRPFAFIEEVPFVKATSKSDGLM